MSSTFSVSLSIQGDHIDFDHCTRAIGLPPSRTWVAKIPLAGVPQRSWSIGFEKRPFDSMNDAILCCLGLVEGFEQRLVSYVASERLSVIMACNIRIIGSRPLYDLSPTSMTRLAGLNAELLLDIFDLSE
jgi:hypothetical protein